MYELKKQATRHKNMFTTDGYRFYAHHLTKLF